ncbi:MAG: site-specific integrase [Acidobacteria bacterium]|nr:site-specific integrase [Acidobacteriota bacterium]
MAGQIIPRGRNVWLVRVFMGRDGTGKRIYESKTIHGNKNDAQAYLNEALRSRDLAGTEAASQRTLVSELLDGVVADYKINGKDHAWAERKVRLHLRPAFGALQVRRLTTTVIQQHILSRQEAGAENATINRELAILKRALNLGRKHTPPKVARVPYIPMLEENNVRKGFFEDDEFLSLREALPSEVRPILIFAYYTGCRKGEILNLKWSQVDLKERVIRLDPGTTKNDEPRVIPITAELLETLKVQKATRDAQYPDCEHVFSRQGEPVKNFRKSWDQACLKAGLWKGDETSGRPTRLFHDLRRTGVRNLVRAGAPERVAMDISGHKTRSVFDRYNIVSESDLRDAATKLDDYITAKRRATTVQAPPKQKRQKTGTP